MTHHEQDCECKDHVQQQHDGHVEKCSGHIALILRFCMHLQGLCRTPQGAHTFVGQQGQLNHPLLRYNEICIRYDEVYIAIWGLKRHLNCWDM